MNAIDQGAILREGDIQIIDSVDNAIELAVIAGDPRKAFRHLNGLKGMAQASAIAICKLLAKMEKQWSLFQDVNDDFYTFATAETGYSKETVRKYIGLWDAVFENPDVPDEIKARLMGKPIKGLLLLTASAREGELDWEQVVSANTEQEIREVIGSTRTSSVNRLVIMLKPDGTLNAKKGEDAYVYFGYLDMQTKDPTCRDAIDRIINSAHIVEQ